MGERDMNRLLKLAKILSRPQFFLPMLRTGVAASVEHEKIMSLLRPAIVVDVGANKGQFALLCHGLFPDATILSFEPLSGPVTIFQKLFKGNSKIHLFSYAVGLEHSSAKIHVSNRDDSSSLLPITLQAEVFPGTEEKDVQKTEVRPLYELLDSSMLVSPALLKIDVQGYELEVLKGCGQLLSKFDYVYVECSFVELYAGQALAHEVISFLEKFGFVLSGVYNLYYDKQGIAIQGDFLFERKNLVT